jgi:hypothetical protein
MRRSALPGGFAAPILPHPAPPKERTPIIVTTYGGVFGKAIREKAVPAFEANNRFKVTVVVSDDVDIMSKLVLAPGRSPLNSIRVDHETAIEMDQADLRAPDQTAKRPPKRRKEFG